MKSPSRFITRVFQNQLAPVTLSVFSFLFCSMANTVIVGQALGTDGLAVMSLVTPVYLTFTTLGALLGVGASIAVAQFLGKNNNPMACQIFTLSGVLVLVLPAVVALLGWLFFEPLLWLLSVPAQLRGAAAAYIRVLLLGGTFLSAVYIPFNFLKLIGRPGFGTAMLLLMAATNVALDILFIYWFGAGIQSIALAIVISSMVAVGVGFAGIFRAKSDLHFCRITQWRTGCRLILSIGTPSAANNLCNALRTILLNGVVLGATGTAGLSALSVMSVLSSISTSVNSGAMQAMTPFISTLSGERDTVGIRELVTAALRHCLPIVGGFTLLLLTVPGWICSMFSVTDPAALAVTIPAIMLFGVSQLPACLNFCAVSVSNALRHTGTATLLTALRALVLVVLFATLLAPYKNAIWLCFPLAELVVLLGYGGYTLLCSRERNLLSRLLLLDTTAEREGKELVIEVESTDLAAAAASEQIGTFCEQNELDAQIVMVMGLAVEEMLVLCNRYAPASLCSLRILLLPNTVVLSIRRNGKPFNPLDFAGGDDLLDESIGIEMVRQQTTHTFYNMAFGQNNLTVVLRKE